MFSLCRKVRQHQPKVRILLILSRGFSASAFLEIDALVDAAIDERDIGGEEHPIVKAFMAIVRAGRYHIPSLRQPHHGVPGPPAPEQRSREPKLTPRQQEMLELLGRGLRIARSPEARGSAMNQLAAT
ncbi:response regulator transcription factor [Microcystis elabens FACHB-917]|nr:response regulator transcription factor [Microcystis elabens FACHB-917]